MMEAKLAEILNSRFKVLRIAKVDRAVQCLNRVTVSNGAHVQYNLHALLKQSEPIICNHSIQE